MKIKLNTISEAITDFKDGKVLIVVDDENRENEGDFVFPAQIITKEIVNFMIKNGRGLVCVPMTSKRCKKLLLQPMVTKNTEVMDTAFTVSVDLKGNGVSSGISASDRSKTIQALVNSDTKPNQLTRPGHVFPLVAKDGGVLRRSGHTEAAVDLARIAGFLPAGVICEIMNEDGSMARLPELIKVAKKFNLKIISIEDLIAYRMKHDTLIQKIDETTLDILNNKFKLHVFSQVNSEKIHFALTLGSWKKISPVLTRMISTNSINNSVNSIHNQSDDELNRCINLIIKNKVGSIIFINQSNESSVVLDSLSKLGNKDIKKPLSSTNNKKMDAKDFGIGAQILGSLDIAKINLLTNRSKVKRVGLSGYGLEILKRIKY
ncbi:MAG: 3,4-dihydroxy-2-butanone-4-phosphate synthase [Flavobacteriaceae bacterium]|nr:3,4-dihydroxy-2-butanone-4-phosphate synthase [Flavobacteriaceae bacterium]